MRRFHAACHLSMTGPGRAGPGRAGPGRAGLGRVGPIFWVFRLQDFVNSGKTDGIMTDPGFQDFGDFGFSASGFWKFG